MESLRDKVAIVGVGYTPQGKVPGRSAISFHVEAARNAIEDAGLKVEDVDGILTQPSPGDPSNHDGQVMPWNAAQQMGMRVRFCSAQTTMGASAGGMVLHGAAALIYGLADYVVCTYGESPQSGRSGEASYSRGWGERAAFGWYNATAGYAMAARRGMQAFNTGPETWSQIAVAQRQWANINPRAAMYKEAMTREDYFSSRFVIEPFRLFDICLVSDGGRAFVMTTAERARDCRHRPVYVMGVGQDHPATNIIQSDFMAGPTGAKVSGQQALRMAGITLNDIDACEIYDCYTYTVELTMMDYGFFASGEGKDFFAHGRTAPGGKLPVNTSGGLLSEAYHMGFTPLTEAVVQLQGSVGERQLGPATGTKSPEIILVSGNGGVLQTHSTVILRR
ncbi:MAG: thiolase family protein [Chloroflexi bacterium]|nr:thiolase family protein [Chloroflexota bacterium]